MFGWLHIKSVILFGSPEGDLGLQAWIRRNVVLEQLGRSKCLPGAGRVECRPGAAGQVEMTSGAAGQVEMSS